MENLETINEFVNFSKDYFYHGTTKENKQNILQNGFVIDYYAQNSFYGNGVYFYDNLKDVKFYDKGGIVKVSVKKTNKLLVFNDEYDFVEYLTKHSDSDAEIYYEENGISYEFAEYYINDFVRTKKIDGFYIKDTNILVVFNPKIMTIIKD